MPSDAFNAFIGPIFAYGAEHPSAQTRTTSSTPPVCFAASGLAVLEIEFSQGEDSRFAVYRRAWG